MKNYLLSLVTFLIPFLNFAQETSEKGLDQQIDEAFQAFFRFNFKYYFF
jgi:AGCS family alanine or glycine:cation symporter